jgi:hypothetical protein
VKSDEYVIAIFDVLGFRTLFERVGLAEIYRRYNKLAAHVREPKSGIDLVPVGGFVAVGHLEVHTAYFSDTLLFWTRYSFPAFRSFCVTCAEVLCQGIEIGLPLRGAISVGTAVMDSDEDFYLGQPIIEAASVEQAQRWIGASFGPSFNRDDDKKRFFLDTVLPFRSHCKPGLEALVFGATLDWPRHWRQSRTVSAASIVTGLDTDPRFSEYYSTTLKFIEFSDANHDWFTKETHLKYA